MSDDDAGEVWLAVCLRCQWETPKMRTFEGCEFKLSQHLEKAHGVTLDSVIIDRREEDV